MKAQPRRLDFKGENGVVASSLHFYFSDNQLLVIMLLRVNDDYCRFESNKTTMKNKASIKSVWSIESFFKSLRMDKRTHLGLGDIRLTIGVQEEICNLVNSSMKRKIINKFNDGLDSIESFIFILGKKGDVFFSEKKDRHLTAKANHYGRKIKTERIVAIHGSTENPVASSIVKCTILE